MWSFGAMTKHEPLSKTRRCHPERTRGIPRYYLRVSQRDPSTPLRSAQDDRKESIVDHASSRNSRLVTAACTNLPQLRLSRPGTCSTALRMAISETASTTHSKLA